MENPFTDNALTELKQSYVQSLTPIVLQNGMSKHKLSDLFELAKIDPEQGKSVFKSKADVLRLCLAFHFEGMYHHIRSILETHDDHKERWHSLLDYIIDQLMLMHPSLIRYLTKNEMYFQDQLHFIDLARDRVSDSFKSVSKPNELYFVLEMLDKAMQEAGSAPRKPEDYERWKKEFIQFFEQLLFTP